MTQFCNLQETASQNHLLSPFLFNSSFKFIHFKVNKIKAGKQLQEWKMSGWIHKKRKGIYCLVVHAECREKIWKYINNKQCIYHHTDHYSRLV